jgi:hypothetical protein
MRRGVDRSRVDGVHVKEEIYAWKQGCSRYYTSVDNEPATKICACTREGRDSICLHKVGGRSMHVARPAAAPSKHNCKQP